MALKLFKISSTLIFTFYLFVISASAAEISYKSTAGVCFGINSVYSGAIKDLIHEVRIQIQEATKKDQYIMYLSVPISSKGGGRFETNNAIANHITSVVQKRFGTKLFVLNPASFNLPKVGPTPAGGGEYMAVWGDVLGGKNGDGSDFDMIYFVGPKDVWEYFGADDEDILGDIERWIDREIQTDKTFDSYMKENDNRKNFLRYYGLRAASSYSKGAHDEWNIAVQLNSRRSIGQDVSIFFNGNSIELGDYDDRTDSGYEKPCE